MSSTEEKVFNEKFVFIQSKIEDYITKRNLRQVQKYINELNALEEKYESCSINDKIAKIGNLKDIAEQFVQLRASTLGLVVTFLGIGYGDGGTVWAEVNVGGQAIKMFREMPECAATSSYEEDLAKARAQSRKLS